MKSQITVRGLDAETEGRLRELAGRQRVSMNKAAVLLIRKGAGLQPEGEGPETVRDSLDSFIGSWTPKQELQFLRANRDMKLVDKELWR